MGHRIHDEAERRQRDEGAHAEQRDRRGRDGGNEGQIQHEVAAIPAVRKHADRKLGEETADQGNRDEGGDGARGEADRLAVDGAHAVERAVDEPGGQAADDAERRDREQALEAEALAPRHLRVSRPRQGDRQQRRRVQHGRQGEQLEIVGIAEVEQERAGGGRGAAGDGVDSKGAAADLVGGAVVEPALHGHEEPGHAVARDGPQGGPKRQRIRHGQEQHGDGGGGGEHGEGTDVADAGDDAVAAQRSRQQADEIGGHDETDGRRRHAARRETQADQREEGSVGDAQQAESEQHRAHGSHDGAERGVHATLAVRLAAPVQPPIDMPPFTRSTCPVM